MSNSSVSFMFYFVNGFSWWEKKIQRDIHFLMMCTSRAHFCVKHAMLQDQFKFTAGCSSCPNTLLDQTIICFPFVLFLYWCDRTIEYTHRYTHTEPRMKKQKEKEKCSFNAPTSKSNESVNLHNCTRVNLCSCSHLSFKSHVPRYWHSHTQTYTCRLIENSTSDYAWACIYMYFLLIKEQLFTTTFFFLLLVLHCFEKTVQVQEFMSQKYYLNTVCSFLCNHACLPVYYCACVAQRLGF